jgi:OOP family OmpA-OmpF porin
MRGVAPQRLSSVGYGEGRPIADNGSASGRALNRRVELELIPSGS